MAPTPLIRNGVYKIRNGQSIKLVADLLRGDPYGLIIATRDRPSNQYNQWRITNYGNGGNQVTIQNEGSRTFAFAPEDQDALLFGSDDHILWTVVKVDGGRFAIQSPNARLVWVLSPGVPDEQIELRHQTGEDITKWFFDFVHP